jgi:hypothetical protein
MNSEKERTKGLKRKEHLDDANMPFETTLSILPGLPSISVEARDAIPSNTFELGDNNP